MTSLPGVPAMTSFPGVPILVQVTAEAEAGRVSAASTLATSAIAPSRRTGAL